MVMHLGTYAYVTPSASGPRCTYGYRCDWLACWQAGWLAAGWLGAPGQLVGALHSMHSMRGGLWHELCEEKQFKLFCAYPRSGFTRDTVESLQEICIAHSRVLA